MLIGLIADIHGDFAAFLRAMRIMERERVSRILCAGDIVDRGADADMVVRALANAGAVCVKGNHEHTVIQFQQRWRNDARAGALARVGRIVSDETLAWLAALPETASLTLAGSRILLAHGTPWSDVLGLFPDTRQGVFEQLRARHEAGADIVILGHTHRPMNARAGRLRILNPGSVYGVTIDDSHTCATLSLPDGAFRVFDLAGGAELDIPLTLR